MSANIGAAIVLLLSIMMLIGLAAFIAVPISPSAELCWQVVCIKLKSLSCDLLGFGGTYTIGAGYKFELQGC